MQRLNDPALFNLIHRLAHRINPDGGKDDLVLDGVEWLKERHGNWQRHCSFSVEVHHLVARQEPKWKLMIVTEYWWGEDRSKALHSSQWAKLVAGDRATALKWLSRQEKLLDRFDRSTGK